MASPAERPGAARTAPRPELNPLLNPLLADNMGRWAEVYFTAAPEKREDAVLELLRELEAEKANHVVSSAPAPAPPVAGIVPQHEPPIAGSEHEDLWLCDVCGHGNPAAHQFCGMCGKQLDGLFSEPLGISADQDPHSGVKETTAAANAESSGDSREPIEEPASAPSQAPRDPYDLSLFQNLREKEYAPNFEDEPRPFVRYRYYVGGVLAILILGLGYMAWRGSGTSQSEQGTPSAPPAAATENTPAPANPNTASGPSNPPKAAQQHTARPAPTSGSPSPTENVDVQNFSGRGAEEFAIAQRYLNNRPRDAAQAAKWLWRAMSKHNGPAALMLADLYLKGDGVPKNCDQARLLLDSAASHSVPGAGDRLRNLQAFGCQ